MVRTEMAQAFCPKCKGSLYMDRDQYGWYEQCLNCGYTRDLRTVVQVPPAEVAPGKRDKRVAVAGKQR